MRWVITDLETKVKTYNRIYFNNEIKLPFIIKWSKHMFNADSDMSAYHSNRGDYHLIMVNIRYKDVSNELLRSTLVHEMIHAWQTEVIPEIWKEEYKKNNGHGPSFLKKCDELNAKFKFTYPLTAYTDNREFNQINKQSQSLYYVYKISSYNENGKTIYFPIGVFVKFLYREEIQSLMKRGLNIKFYKKPYFSNICSLINFRNKPIIDTKFYVTYNNIKKVNKDNFTQELCDNGFKMYFFSDDDFNFNDDSKIIL